MSKDFLRFIRDRVSNNQLVEPAPSHEEWLEILDAASRAADHGNLKPWRFKIFEGEGRRKVGEVYWRHAKSEVEQLSDDKAEVFIKKAFRAPTVLLVYADIVDHPKVPEFEQLMAVAASAQQVLLGVEALDYAGIWRTGPAVFTDDAKEQLGLEPNQQVVGLIYVGTASVQAKRVEDTGITERITFVSE
ncbi:nitroreductase family protein [Marinomonas atlantica]|uniref:nitroreductase family protein n=1 Tax=Marinomonas atlantica TaxID=1806668 RepID=UPI000830F567|nr:nitroreductase [Marinomonas atlantica]MCO4785779.1 nitroreductase [Marinomonas atlantica]